MSSPTRSSILLKSWRIWLAGIALTAVALTAALVFSPGALAGAQQKWATVLGLFGRPAADETDAKAIEPLDVVFVADFSGPGKEVGNSLAKGFKDAIASRPGTDVMRILVRDDQGRAEAVEALAEGAASGYSTLALVGPTQAAGFQSFASAAEQGQVPALIPVAPPIRLFKPNWLFSLQPSQPRQGEFAGQIVQRIRSAKQVCFVISEGMVESGYWWGVAQSFSERNGVGLAIKRLQGKAGSVFLEGETSALESYDLLFVDLPSDMAVTLLKTLKEDGYKGTIVGLNELSLPDFPKRFNGLPFEQASPGFYTNGMFAWTPFTPDVSGERSRALADDYADKYGSDPSWAYAYGYDAGMMLADFAAQFIASGHSLKSTPPEEWRAALRDYLERARLSPNPISGFTGVLRFDTTHQREVPPTLVVYRDGRQMPYLEQYSDGAPHVEKVQSNSSDKQVEVDGRFYDLVPVVYSGLRFQSISEVDFINLAYTAEFDLWFKSTIPLKPEDIHFPNAVEDSVKGEIVESVDNTDQKYRRMRFEGKFKFESSPRQVLLERVVLPLSWRHRNLDSSQLRFVVDSSGYNDDSVKYPLFEQVNREASLAPALGFKATGSVIAVENRAARALGDPRSTTGSLRFSTIGERMTLESKSSNLGPTLARSIHWQGAMAIAGLLLALFTLIGIFRRFLRRFSLTFDLLRVGLVAGTLLLIEVAAFGSPLLETLPSGWLLVVRNSFTLAYYLAAAYAIDAIIWGFLRRGSREARNPFQGTIKVLITFTVLMSVLATYYTNVLGRDVLPLLATSSVVLTVVGLALRELILDAISGVAIVFEGSPKVGQWVMTKSTSGSSLYGVIEALGWRSVRLRSRDDQVHFVPNSMIVTNTLSNFSMNQGFTRAVVPFEVSSSADLQAIVEIVAQGVSAALSNDPGVNHNRPIQIVCTDLEGGNVEMEAQVFYRADMSLDSLRTRVLQTVSAILQHHDALPMLTYQLADSRRKLQST
jgi:potassium efflux system protein